MNTIKKSLNEYDFIETTYNIRGKEHPAYICPDDFKDYCINHYKINKRSISSTLYLISDGTYLKIGVTQKGKIAKRLQSLQTGNPHALVCVFFVDIQDALALELSLHRKFQKKRLKGEWFNVTREEVKKEIKRIIYV